LHFPSLFSFTFFCCVLFFMFLPALFYCLDVTPDQDLVKLLSIHIISRSISSKIFVVICSNQAISQFRIAN
jgi:hypothetical protein